MSAHVALRTNSLASAGAVWLKASFFWDPSGAVAMWSKSFIMTLFFTCTCVEIHDTFHT